MNHIPTMIDAMSIVTDVPDDRVAYVLIDHYVDRPMAWRVDHGFDPMTVEEIDRLIGTAYRLATSIVADREWQRTIDGRTTDPTTVPVSAPVLATDDRNGRAIVAPVPDVFDRRNHTTTERRTNTGRTERTVTKYGRASIVGSFDVGSIADDRARAAATALASLRPLVDGTIDTRAVDAIVDAYYPELGDRGHGNDVMEWHEMTDDDSGMVAGDWNTIHRNPSGPYDAASMLGYIDDDDVLVGRDVANPIATGTARPITKWPTRYRLRTIRPRSNDPIGADHELLAPHTDPTKVWVGHRLRDRGRTVRDVRSSMGRRAVILARHRSDVRPADAMTFDDLTIGIRALADGDSIIGTVDDVRVRVSRPTVDRYSITAWKGTRKQRADRIPTVDRAIERARRMIDA